MRIKHDNSNPNISKIELVTDSGHSHELFIESNVELDNKADCWIYLMLPVCMHLGEDLEVVGTLSAQAIEAFELAKKDLLRGHTNMTDIKLIHSQPQKTEEKPGKAIGLFYSGGLDSTYAAETLPQVETLISVWGFDIPIKNQRHWDLSMELLVPYAKELGKSHIWAKTNIRELSNGLIEWGRDYHGTAIAGVAKALSKHVKHVYAAAGYIRTDPNWGHSPILYNAFSTANLKVEETEPVLRIAKAAALANNPRTTQIRACYRNVKGKANCGSCKKCVRTRYEFDLVQAKYRPLGLDTKPSAKELLKNKLTNWDYLFYKEAFDWSKEQGFKVPVATVLLVALTRFKSIFQLRWEKILNRMKKK